MKIIVIIDCGGDTVRFRTATAAAGGPIVGARTRLGESERRQSKETGGAPRVVVMTSGVRRGGEPTKHERSKSNDCPTSDIVGRGGCHRDRLRRDPSGGKEALETGACDWPDGLRDRSPRNISCTRWSAPPVIKRMVLVGTYVYV